MSNQSTNFGLPRLKIRQFTGQEDEDFDTWFDDFEGQIGAHGLDEASKLKLLKANISGVARLALKGTKAASITTLKDAYRLLQRGFSFKTTAEWSVKLQNTKRNPKESLDVFAFRIDAILPNAYPHAIHNIPMMEQVHVEHFLRGLAPDMEHYIRSRKPTNIEEAIERGKIFETDANLPSKKKERKETLAVASSDAGTYNKDCDEGTCEFLSKRNGETQPVTMCTIMQSINNNHKQQQQAIKDYQKQVSTNMHSYQQQHQSDLDKMKRLLDDRFFTEALYSDRSIFSRNVNQNYHNNDRDHQHQKEFRGK